VSVRQNAPLTKHWATPVGGHARVATDIKQLVELGDDALVLARALADLLHRHADEPLHLHSPTRAHIPGKRATPFE